MSTQPSRPDCIEIREEAAERVERSIFELTGDLKRAYWAQRPVADRATWQAADIARLPRGRLAAMRRIGSLALFKHVCDSPNHK
jgi:hypothetical protein